MLGARLDASFAHLGDPAAIQTLAELCDRAGLARLAQAWRDIRSCPTDLDSSGRPTFPQSNEPGGRVTWPWFLSPGMSPG